MEFLKLMLFCVIQLNSEVRELKETVVNLSDELNSSREEISLLQQQLDLACRQKESLYV